MPFAPAVAFRCARKHLLLALVGCLAASVTLTAITDAGVTSASGHAKWSVPRFESRALATAVTGTTDPTANIAPSPAYPSACQSAPNGTSCITSAVSALNNARYHMGLPYYVLPSSFATLPWQTQLLILSNQDRSLYGLTAITGLNATLNNAAAAGVAANTDPTGPSVVDGQHFRAWTSNWAAGWSSALYSYYEWMYDDGPGSSNIDCPAGGGSGCWGHRHDTLMSLNGGTQLAMGAATGTNSTYATEFTALYESFAGPVTYIPTVYGISPSAGSAGTQVTITGAGFVAMVGAYFGSTAGTLLAVTPASIVVSAPTGNGTTDVWVQTTGGTSALISADLFAYSSSASTISSTGSSLTPGATLSLGQGIESSNGLYEMGLRSDGNVIEVSVPDGRVMWSSNTAGRGGTKLVLQADNNFVLYTSSNVPIWYTSTYSGASNASTQLVMQGDGNAVLYVGGSALWATYAMPDRISAGASLLPGQTVKSADGRHYLAMQTDGNLVLYGPSGPTWSSNTWGHPYSWAVVQGDGNLVVYTPANAPIWNSRTSGIPTVLIVQGDGNLVLYTAALQPRWFTATH